MKPKYVCFTYGAMFGVALLAFLRYAFNADYTAVYPFVIALCAFALIKLQGECK